MPARIRYDVAIKDRSPLARNMYQVLFSGQDRFHLQFTDDYTGYFKRSPRLRPDLLLVNSNSLGAEDELKFPCPTILIVSGNRADLKEKVGENRQVSLGENPFYPYELLSLATRMVRDKREAPRRGRPPGRSQGKGGKGR